MHMTGVISCNEMWNDHTCLQHILCKAGQHDYTVLLSDTFSELWQKNTQPCKEM